MQTIDSHPDDMCDGDVGDLPVTYPHESLAETLNRIVTFNKRFIHHADESTHDLIALWVASTHAMPIWDWHGRIYITAPQPGCGKTTQAEVMALMCPNSVDMASTSGPGLFRLISAEQPTLFIDEAESQFSSAAGRDGEIVNQVINKGYRPGGCVTRSEGNRAVKHSVYAAVAIVGIDNNNLQDTTRSRCIPVQMTPGGKRPEKFRPRRHEEFGNEIRWHLANHALGFELIDLDPEEFVGRHSDIWEALYAVAVAAGPEWERRFSAAAAVHVWPDEVSESAQVLKGIYDYFAEAKVDRVKSDHLVTFLNSKDDVPAITSPRALARKWLQGYRTADGGRIKTTKSNGNYVYWRRDFEHPFTTWLGKSLA